MKSANLNEVSSIMANTKKNVKAAPRRSVDSALADAISGNVRAVVAKATAAEKKAAEAQAAAVPARAFEKLSVTVSSDVAQELRVAAVIDHRVSESALIETALRRFLKLPKADRVLALAGQGRRRRAG